MEVYSEILKRLDEWEQEIGSLPEAMKLYRQITAVQGETAAGIAPDLRALPRSKVEEKIKEGVPVLDWHTLSLDTGAVQSVFLELCRVAARGGQLTRTNVTRLKKLGSDASLLEEAASLWWQNQSLAPIAEKVRLEEGLIGTMLQMALKPFLVVYTQSLIKLVSQEQWRRASCPICGGAPDFAYLDRERGARWLLCSRCDAQWLFQRLECPYCGTTEQESLSYYADDAGLYRLYVCEKCHSCLKAVDLRQTESPVVMPLERIITADMDRQAGEKGYHPGCVREQPPVGS